MNHLTITYERLFLIFFEQQVEPNKQFHSKECSRGGLFRYIRDIEQNGRNSSRFLEFRDYFTDIDFFLSTTSTLG
jgi:hypothetical protein